MLSHISWNSYFEFIAIALTLYYGALLLLFYGNRFQNLLQLGLFNRSEPQDFDSAGNAVLPYGADGSAADDESKFYSLIDELNAFFEQARKTKCVKQELIGALKKITSKHTISENSFYKQSVTNLITVQCKNICSLQLSETDMALVWM